MIISHYEIGSAGRYVRLKYDRAIIKRELGNLPETLYEVYRRIWSMIHKDEAIFVFHVLQWIIHHNVLNKGEGIPIPVLLQATEKSITRFTGHPNIRAYDEDILQEVCGCLIQIEKPPHSRTSSVECKPASASFAHYTVREFLDSKQFSSTSALSSALCPGNLGSHIMEIVFTVVLCIEISQAGEEGH